jgi:signal transduction histidine kinase
LPSSGSNENILSQRSSYCYIKFVLSVQDFGCGIPEDKLDSIFVNFGNLAEHQNANPTGRGLGLSICKAIIEQMGGHVHVES